ncbi:potassium channel family protein [Salinispora arenicola]|uniref:potassium channel family protein n=1 Tax=Salinispora arenicola TaxID=168697 RepID=UPI0020795D75|nr:potassium channel family protein [Salinispora arenicola]MCN0150890.1 potassium channel family protein [Salinispora arenicola]
MIMGNTGSTSRREQQAMNWERLTALPLTILSLGFLAAYAAPILDPQLNSAWTAVCRSATFIIWLLFWLDMVVRFVLHTQRLRFLREHLFDLAVLILPILRPLRAMRLVTVVLSLSRRTEVWVRGRLGIYVAATTVLLVLVASLAVLDAERGAPDPSITNYSDAVWWAAVTITTVGYGDFYPVTTEGRLVAVGLMIGGIGLIGFVTGSLATWIVDRVTGRDRHAAATADDVAALRQEIVALRQQLELSEGTTPGESATPPVQPARTPHA